MSRLPLGRNRYAELATTNSNSHTSPTTTASSTYSASDLSSNQFNGHEQDYHAKNPAPVSQMNPYQTPMVNGTTSYANNNQTQSYTSQNTPQHDLNAGRKSSKSKQIDTDKIPRPVIDAESSYNPQTYTTSANVHPPPSYTNFITVDDGNAGPRYVRSTFYKVPIDESMINNTQIPLSLIIQPLADPSPEEEACPIIDYGETGPIRCNRCRAYINPNWTFTHNGNIGVCNLCRMGNELPKEYYCPLDMSGARTDKLEKPELCKGVYEFIAPTAYHTRPVVSPNILFCIEASSASYLSGVFHQVFSSLQALLDYIPSPELVKICIATYDTGMNFFKVPDDLTKEMSVIHISDIHASCLPLPKKYLFLSLQDERDKINYLIERILRYYETNERLQKSAHAPCFGAAIVDSCDILLKEGGRVLAFSTEAPTVGIGALQNRDDHKSYGTEKEKALYIPQGDGYSLWAKRSLEKRISIDLFCFSPHYFDLVTIGQISSVTGGNIYYYPTYNPSYDGERLHYDIARNLTRYVGYDAIMVIRTCQGLSLQEYVTPAGKKTEPELEFSSIDADTAITAYFKYDEKLTDDNVSFQAAMLYTNPYGQRVIRVINFRAGTSNDLVTIFRSCDVETVAQSVIKRAALNISTMMMTHIRKNLLDMLINILYNYRQHCASTSSQSQLILPDSLKVLPVYFLAVFKSHLFKPGTTGFKPDERAFELFRLTKYPLNVISNIMYPKVYALHTIWTEDEYAAGNAVNNRISIGGNLPASTEKLDDDGLYLIDNAETLFIYVRRNADPIYFQHLFGVETYQEVAGVTSFPESIESEYFSKVYNIIDQLRKNKNAAYQPVRIVTEKDPVESIMLNFLVEDERQGESYSHFLCNIHKLIQEKFA